MFAYNAWANRDEVRHLRSLSKPPEKAIKLLAHIIGTEWLFLGRLRRETKPAIVWPNLTLDQIAAQIEKLAAAWPSEFGRTDKGREMEQPRRRHPGPRRPARRVSPRPDRDDRPRHGSGAGVHRLHPLHASGIYRLNVSRYCCGVLPVARRNARKKLMRVPNPAA